ncbi:sulfatase [Haloarcula onubensis]|uniref:Sulfatase n=1 Tax=Haloarcula onubensis TaxID=2950539 RepID=A0ABU2FLW6_9EURY|nr:sulfatase [Halomicroarcula sp. S3CR25-11]MDS0281738.1 sulfatase [Halomicroarcula sp. S3CR25-11]
MTEPNILWITLDSVRSDHTGIDGYTRDTTPEIDRLAADGYGFNNCFAHGKSTLPSSGGILTGSAPSRTTLGITGNSLPDGVTTVAERFAEGGYTTACLSRNSFVSGATGLDRGFDRFQWLASSTITDAGIGTLVKYLFNIREHSAGFTTDTAKHASPYLMNEVAKKWLADFERGDDPFFFYLHYNEPHRPYYPPGKFIDAYTDGLEMSAREAAEFALDFHYNLDEAIATDRKLTQDESDALQAMYDAEIAYTDYMVGRLVDHVESLDLSNTVVVVTGDHGELFGEYGLYAHSYVLMDGVTRVPLVLYGVDSDLAVAEEDIVQHSDVMTTLLAMAGCDADGTIGVDLREESRSMAVSQRGPASFDGLLEHNPEFDTSRFLDGIMTSVRTETHRFERGEDREQLFELPDEETPVDDEQPDVAQALGARLDEWIDEYGEPVGEAKSDEFSGAVRKQLSDLGYLD